MRGCAFWSNLNETSVVYNRLLSLPYDTKNVSSIH